MHRLSSPQWASPSSGQHAATSSSQHHQVVVVPPRSPVHTCRLCCVRNSSPRQSRPCAAVKPHLSLMSFEQAPPAHRRAPAPARH
eukprot:scaffold1025_cov79-Phaeocystis_antarctica.AAC.1